MLALARLGLLLLLWLSALAHAQPVEAPPPASDAPTLPPLVTAPEEPEEPPKGELIPRRRVPAQEASDLFVPRLLLGPLLGGVAASCGAALGLFLGVTVTRCDVFEGGCDDVALLVPTVVGGLAAGSLGVYGMGSFMNGQGQWLPTLLGTALGMGLGIVAVAASSGTAWFALPLVTGMGAVAGYEISHSLQSSAQEEDEEARAGLLLMPVLGRTPEGGLLGGLAGRF
jgi:hypothetical protein